jgi:hypothetical protein
MVVDGATVVLHRCSNPAATAEFSSRKSTIGEAVSKAESAVRHTMESCRPGANFTAFRLNWSASRIYVAALSDKRRLVVINKGCDPAADSPEFDRNLNLICEQLKAAVVAGPAS